jgi:hypothetical protein
VPARRSACFRRTVSYIMKRFGTQARRAIGRSLFVATALPASQLFDP